MKLLEYQAKNILKNHEIPVPESFIVNSGKPDFLPAVIKSQVPVGGRGKAGGVAIVTTNEELDSQTEKIKQLEIKGFLPQTLLAEELIEIKRELYLSLLIDKQTMSIVLMAHAAGGVEVEENNADDFFRTVLTKQTIESAGEKLAEYFDLPDKTFVLQELVIKLYDCFIKSDAVLLEINPLIYTNDGSFIAGDCKMELDDAASFRHPEWHFEQEQSETNFVTLDEHGEVATIANGAGLAMATVDAVADAGLKPANFLDIGGGANEASVLAAFERIVKYPDIQVIIINIFAGITRCDEIAKAVIAAKAHIPDLPPLYIRLAGTNFEQAVALLAAEQIPTLATLEQCIAAAREEMS
jgi:succinyl-CoA synthetase beta subunit